MEQRPGTADRRQRLLFTTSLGHQLAVRLAKLQTRRIMRALASGGGEMKDTASQFLLAMIDPADREHVRRIVFGTEGPLDE